MWFSSVKCAMEHLFVSAVDKNVRLAAASVILFHSPHNNATALGYSQSLSERAS